MGGIGPSEREIIFVCHQIMNQNQSDKKLSKRKWMRCWKRPHLIRIFAYTIYSVVYVCTHNK